eukprot:1687009-Prymnesium_polylepis.2
MKRIERFTVNSRTLRAESPEIRLPSTESREGANTVAERDGGEMSVVRVPVNEVEEAACPCASFESPHRVTHTDLTISAGRGRTSSPPTPPTHEPRRKDTAPSGPLPMPCPAQP